MSLKSQQRGARRAILQLAASNKTVDEPAQITLNITNNTDYTGIINGEALNSLNSLPVNLGKNTYQLPSSGLGYTTITFKDPIGVVSSWNALDNLDGFSPVLCSEQAISAYPNFKMDIDVTYNPSTTPVPTPYKGLPPITLDANQLTYNTNNGGWFPYYPVYQGNWGFSTVNLTYSGLPTPTPASSVPQSIVNFINNTNATVTFAGGIPPVLPGATYPITINDLTTAQTYTWTIPTPVEDPNGLKYAGSFTCGSSFAIVNSANGASEAPYQFYGLDCLLQPYYDGLGYLDPFESDQRGKSAGNPLILPRWYTVPAGAPVPSGNNFPFPNPYSGNHALLGVKGTITLSNLIKLPIPPPYVLCTLTNGTTYGLTTKSTTASDGASPVTIPSGGTGTYKFPYKATVQDQLSWSISTPQDPSSKYVNGYFSYGLGYQIVRGIYTIPDITKVYVGLQGTLTFGYYDGTADVLAIDQTTATNSPPRLSPLPQSDSNLMPPGLGYPSKILTSITAVINFTQMKKPSPRPVSINKFPAKFFAPFVDVTINNPPDLTDIYRETECPYYTLAFMNYDPVVLPSYPAGVLPAPAPTYTPLSAVPAPAPYNPSGLPYPYPTSTPPPYQPTPEGPLFANSFIPSLTDYAFTTVCQKLNSTLYPNVPTPTPTPTPPPTATPGPTPAPTGLMGISTWGGYAAFDYTGPTPIPQPFSMQYDPLFYIDNINAIRNAGGDVIISFGGENAGDIVNFYMPLLAGNTFIPRLSSSLNVNAQSVIPGVNFNLFYSVGTVQTLISPGDTCTFNGGPLALFTAMPVVAVIQSGTGAPTIAAYNWYTVTGLVVDTGRTPYGPIGTTFFAIADAVIDPNNLLAYTYDTVVLKTNGLTPTLNPMQSCDRYPAIFKTTKAGITHQDLDPDGSLTCAGYKRVIDAYDLQIIDFDIEGSAAQNRAAIHKRNQALVKLRADPKYAGIKIHFTVAALTTGMTDAVYIFQDAAAQGLKVDVCNVMAMDYGAYLTDPDMGKAAINTAISTYAQVRQLFNDITIGITPMIGFNDSNGPLLGPDGKPVVNNDAPMTVSEVFTLDNARQVVDFVYDTPWVSRLSFWSVDRDKKYPAASSL